MFQASPTEFDRFSESTNYSEILQEVFKQESYKQKQQKYLEDAQKTYTNFIKSIFMFFSMSFISKFLKGFDEIFNKNGLIDFLKQDEKKDISHILLFIITIGFIVKFVIPFVFLLEIFLLITMIAFLFQSIAFLCKSKHIENISFCLNFVAIAFSPFLSCIIFKLLLMIYLTSKCDSVNSFEKNVMFWISIITTFTLGFNSFFQLSLIFIITIMLYQLATHKKFQQKVNVENIVSSNDNSYSVKTVVIKQCC